MRGNPQESSPGNSFIPTATPLRDLGLALTDGKNETGKNHRVMELLRLEKVFMAIESIMLRPPPPHVLQCHIHVDFERFQEWWNHHWVSVHRPASSGCRVWGTLWCWMTFPLRGLKAWAWLSSSPQILGARRVKEELCRGERHPGRRVLLVLLPALAKGVLQVPQLPCKSQDYFT